MPVDFQQIQSQIIEMGKKAKERQVELNTRRELAYLLLGKWAAEMEALRQRVEQAAQLTPTLRCAVPLDAPLSQTFPLPGSAAEHTLLAADGSQINPNPHDPVEFAVINVGAFRVRAGEIPREYVDSQLLYHESLYSSYGMITEEIVALMRDLNERRYLAQLAEKEQGAVITLTDGQLEPFHQPREEPVYNKNFEEFLGALDRLADLGAATAGYVDKPASSLVVRLLELAELPEEKLDEVGKLPVKLRGITDRELFRELLQPGERTALFGIQSQTAQRFEGRKALRFFYMNVGRLGHPWLVRVELPAWVAGNTAQLNLLHSALWEQCLQMGARPYPYALQRAHEVAVVTLDEKVQLMDMIGSELLRQGVTIGELSYKQSGKDLPGRQRYKR